MAPAGAIAVLLEENRMSQQFNVAVLGASGAVGQAMIEILEEREFPVATL